MTGQRRLPSKRVQARARQERRRQRWRDGQQRRQQQRRIVRPACDPMQRLLYRVRKDRCTQSLQNDGRVCGAVDRLQAGNSFNVAGIGNNGGDGAELFEFRRHTE